MRACLYRSHPSKCLNRSNRVLVFRNSTADGIFYDFIDILWLCQHQCFDHTCSLKHVVVSEIARGGKGRLRPESRFILTDSFGFSIFLKGYSQTLAAMLGQESRKLLQ